jgi:hypothetical protein
MLGIIPLQLSVDLIFSPQYLKLDGSSPHSAALLAVNLLSSVATACLLMPNIVGKSKKVLDHTASLYLLHFIITMFYSGGSTDAEYCIVNLLGAIVCTCLGEWVCSKSELGEIPSLLG